MNVQLSLDETYADIAPVRAAGQTSAFVSIMRGCNNMVRTCCRWHSSCLSRDHALPLAACLHALPLAAQLLAWVQ